MKNESKILVRIQEKQHKALKELAARSRRSLNTVCVLALEALLERESSAPAPRREARRSDTLADLTPLESIIGEFEPDLEGVVLFGSAARGSASARSDIDVLLVLQPGCALNRDLYVRWDDFASRAGASKRISPHFSRLPASCERAGSLWFELALEGIVLWERDFSVSNSLAHLRHWMFENNIRRKLSYGMPYWVRGDGKHQARGRLPEACRTPPESS